MGDVVSDTDVDNWLDVALTDVSTKSDGDEEELGTAYKKIYNTLVKKLEDKTSDLPGLMSQAVVPRLIRRMANIPKIQRSDIANLRAMLVGNPEDNISADYPYSRTQIMDAYTRIQDEVVMSLRRILKDPIEFGNPLLGTAVLIADKTVPAERREVFLGDSDRIQEFSMRVNLIQDVIVRHLIFGQSRLVPLVGDETLPATEKKRDKAKKDLKKRALGLGKNPNPEMAAILNPGLVMDQEDQKKYLKELGILAELISPEEATYNKSVLDAFQNAGFAFSQADLNEEVKRGEKGAIDEIKETGSVSGPTYLAGSADRDALEAAQAFNEEMARQVRELETEKESLQLELKKADKKLKKREEAFREQAAMLKKLQAGKGPPAEPKLEKTVDYNLMALEYLVGYMGLDAKIPGLVAKTYELNDVSSDPKESIKKEIDTMLGDLIQGNEKLMIRRKNTDKGTYAAPRKGTKLIVKVLTHEDAINAWRSTLKKSAKPELTDLIYVRALVDKKKAEKLTEKLDKALRKAKTVSSSINYTIERTQHKNGRKKIRKDTEKVLLW